MFAAACSGGLSHRTTADISVVLPIGQEVRRIRFELQDGSVEVHPGTERTIDVRGGLRLAADTAEDLLRLQSIPIRFHVAPDPDQPTTMVVTAPVRRPDDPLGVVAFELALHLPADLPFELRIHANGGVVAHDRKAETVVETGRGDLRFADCSGGVRAESGNGNVLVSEHRGELDVRARVGNMQAFVREPGSLIRLATGQGTIQCHVPPQLDFELDARAETGKIGNGFDLPVAKVGSYGAALTGTRGSGRTKIVLRTGSGHLSLSPHAKFAGPSSG